MRNPTFTWLLTGCLTLSCGIALADPAYKATDIVNHFAKQQVELGAKRGLCIGTEAQCREQKEQQVNALESFDLVINFNYNSDDLTPDARRNLDEFARALKDPRLARASFMVEGHTDGAGSDEFNLALSERRANAVVRYLAAKGIESARIVSKGYGEAKPKVPDPLNPANRRVETRLRVD